MARETTDATMAKLSVIVVSDYAAGEEKSWEDLRRALRAWAEQEGPPVEEFILVESARLEGRVPDDVSGIIPNMKVLYVDAESSYELKNRAAEMATGDWLAIVDADCIPGRTWLRVLRAALAEHPDAAAVSARTLYPGRSRMERILGLLSRSYLDPGRAGLTRFISGNAIAATRFLPGLAPLPHGSSRRRFFETARVCGLSRNWWWCMTLKGGRWNGISGAITGIARSLPGCATRGCRMPGSFAPVPLPSR